MNILDSIMNAGNGAAVRQIGSQGGWTRRRPRRRSRPWCLPCLQVCSRIYSRPMALAELSARCREATISGMSIIPRSSVMRDLSPMATAFSGTSSAARTSAAGLRLRLVHKRASVPT